MKNVISTVFDGEIKLKLSRKRLFPTVSVKYVGVKIDGNLSWKSQIDFLSVKLSRASALLFKIRNLVNSSILRTVQVGPQKCSYFSLSITFTKITKIFSPQLLEVYRILLVEATLELMFYYTSSVLKLKL